MFRLWTLASVGLAVGAASYAAYVTTTWLSFGRKKRSGDPLLDAFMPEADACERHSVSIRAPAEVTFAAAKDLRLDASPVVRAIFRGRELIFGTGPAAPLPPVGFVEQMKSIGWGVLAEREGRAIAMGAVTEPWEPSPVFRPLSPDELAAFDEPGHVKIAWTLRADPARDGESIFRTETRALATDPVARRRFRWYWAFLSPGILLVRSALLPLVKHEAERRWSPDRAPLPGDDVYPAARAQFTHAVVIAAPARDVWPWLVQMGRGRAGWYSWDLLDNGGIKSADHVVPGLQRLKVGDVIPVAPDAKEGFEVLRLEPNRAMILRSRTPLFEGTWAFVLEPLGAGATRLITRYRAAYPPSVRMALMRPWMALVHGIMERKQLRTLKRNVEGARGWQAVERWPGHGV